MAAYSFLDVSCTLSGPGGFVNLGNESGAAEEGITVEMAEDKNTLTMGADGTPMHSLHAAKHGIIRVRLLKISPRNAQLSTMYGIQTVTSALHGLNTLVVRDVSRGDFISARSVAFKRHPNFAAAKTGNVLEWSFDAGYIDMLLGDGVPALTR